MYREEDVTTDTFVKMIFSGKVLPEKSVPFCIESQDNEISLFSVLVDILHSGMKLLFANETGHIDLSTLSDSDIHSVVQRFRAISVDLNMALDHSLHSNVYMEDTGSLADSFLILHSRATGSNYKIKFALL